MSREERQINSPRTPDSVRRFVFRTDVLCLPDPMGNLLELRDASAGAWMADANRLRLRAQRGPGASHPGSHRRSSHLLREEVNRVTKVKEIIRRRGRSVLIVTTVVLGVLLTTGCQSGTSVTNETQQLIQQYPWLSRLAFAFLEGLVEGLGWNLGALLRAAAAALLAG
jgi:hypothetical protein